jgi:molybdate transport system permease protein
VATLGREWAGASRGRSRAGSSRRPELGLAIPWLPVASLPYVLLIMLPLLGLIGRAVLTGDLVAAVRNPIVVDALRLSVTTASLSTLATFVFGSPFALLIARWRGLGRNLVETLVDLPLVLPPTVAGLALLITFGRRGVLGPTLSLFGIELPFTTAAVVIAQLFVSAPLYVRTAIVGFGSLPREVAEAAALDGAGRWGAFRHVVLPLTSPLLLGGAVMTWARALGEFGATIMFAGNLPGRTQTMPLAIYGAFEQDLDASIGLAIFLVLASGLVLMLVRALTQGRLADTLRALVG